MTVGDSHLEGCEFGHQDDVTVNVTVDDVTMDTSSCIMGFLGFSVKYENDKLNFY